MAEDRNPKEKSRGLKQLLQRLNLNSGSKQYRAQFTEVMPGVCISSFPDQEMWKKHLNARGFRRVISCVEPNEFTETRLTPAFYQSRGIVHTVVPLKSNQHGYINEKPLLLEQCARVVHQIKIAIETRENTLIHCGSGKGRSLTPLIAAIALLPEQVNEKIAVFNAEVDDPDERLESINHSSDTLEQKARKVYDWLKASQANYHFDFFETMRKDVSAVVRQYLNLYPGYQMNATGNDTMELDSDGSDRESESDEEDHSAEGGISKRRDESGESNPKQPRIVP